MKSLDHERPPKLASAESVEVDCVADRHTAKGQQRDKDHRDIGEAEL